MYDLCRRSLRSGETFVERFGYSDEDAFAVGLTCGGEIEVLITPVTHERKVVASALGAVSRGGTVALARVTGGTPDLLGTSSLVHPDGTYETEVHGTEPRDLVERITAEAGALLDAGRTGTVELCGLTVLVESRVPPPRMIVFGAIDFAAALVRTAKLLGYHVTVCDARPVFATRARFPEADDIVVDWPHRYLRRTATDGRTVLCVLTHDAKFDVPLLREALRLPVAYVGAMGSRRTHADRERRLREAGLGERELARLRSPIGLDLGARTPEETAVSIAAEIIAARRGGTGRPLTDSGAPIHRKEAVAAA
ncbi:XdhC family protein [Streptomyces cinereospinus]